MKFLFLLAFTVCLGSVKAQDHSVIKTTFDNDLIRFAADILIPYKQHEPRTGLVLIQGSGTSDRSNKWSGAFAEFLANNGFFVLHPDKRGSGSSTGDW